ncbi:MAG: hypothetical protein ACKOX3_08710 [Bacteroidota bacterium]
MRKYILFSILFLTWGVTNAQIQMSASSLVTTAFNTEVFREEFDTASADWPTISNFNNLFMVQGGAYYMNRKAASDPYAVLSSYKLHLSNYQLNVRLNPMSFGQDGYIGVLFMLQESSVGGFIFEITSDSKYRLRQVRNGLYKNITGDLQSNGWITNEGLINYNQNNSISIAFNDRKYDLYLNAKRVISFSDIEYKQGVFGFLIGPQTKVMIDNIAVMTSEDKLTVDNPFSATANDKANEEVLKLKAQIEKLQNDNDELLNVVENMKSKGYFSPDDFESKYVSAVATNNAMKLKYDSLVVEYLHVKVENDSLKKVQAAIVVDDHSLDSLVLEIDELKVKNGELLKENAILNNRIKKLTGNSPNK